MYVHYIHHNVPHHYHRLHQCQHQHQHHHHHEPHLAQGGRGQWGWRGLRGGSSPSQPPPYQSFLWKTFPGGWGARCILFTKNLFGIISDQNFRSPLDPNLKFEFLLRAQMHRWYKDDTAFTVADQQTGKVFLGDIILLWIWWASTGLLLRFWLRQGKEKRLLARILTKARKRLSRQNSTKKCVNLRKNIQVRQRKC